MTSKFIALSLLLSLSASLLPALAQQPSAVDGAKALVQPKEQSEDAPCVQWVDPDVKTRAVLLCIHGLGLHKGTYESFGKEMSKYGIATYATDCRGFGQWLKMNKHTTVDFDGTLSDIKSTLEKLRANYPGVPIVILGESMGGAIALHATALYPNLIDGLISSVPSGDRYNETGQNLKVGFHILTGGMNKPLNIGNTIVRQATKKSDLRTEWSEDPMGKMELSPAELMHFSKFMSENFQAAHMIQSTPVLFIQGVGDKLVRPAGTWKLCDSLSTPNHQFVLSKNGEHLIFEDSQFLPEDLLFVRTWINKNVAPLDRSAVASATQEPAVLSTENNRNGQDLSQGAKPDNTGGSNTSDKPPIEVASTTTTQTPAPPPPTIAPPAISHSVAPGGDRESISYWIELYRDGKIYRCNNKTQFRSGDAIRFHLVPGTNGYAYIVMKESSSGKRAVLFPTERSGTNNFLRAKQDYALPNKTWLQFDKHAGIEHLSLVFSQQKMDPAAASGTYVTAFISHETSGSKDLVPTRMELSWDDPTPVIMPDSAPAQTAAVASAVHISSDRGEGVLAVEIALAHQ